MIDLGRKPVARFLHGEAQLSDEAVSHDFLETVVSQVSSMTLACTYAVDAAPMSAMLG